MPNLFSWIIELILWFELLCFAYAGFAGLAFGAGTFVFFSAIMLAGIWASGEKVSLS